MKAELNTLIATLKTKYAALEQDYTDQCAIDYMSRRATYLDGQLATLHEVIELLEDANEEAADAIADDMDDEGEDDFDIDDDVDETNYDPYCGCELYDDGFWCE